LVLCERLQTQEKTDSKKLYSLHEPEVMCISKGKAHKRYEFGQKVSVATTNRNNWIVGVRLCEGNPYDGHTLAKAIAGVQQTTGVSVTAAFVDKGYRGHDYQGEATIHLAGSISRNLTRGMKRRRKRRSAGEPTIDHLKSDHRIQRCVLKGLIGNAINATLAAAGSNLRKLLRALAHALLLWLRYAFSVPDSGRRDRLSPVMLPLI
jgi:IS5 family transposase